MKRKYVVTIVIETDEEGANGLTMKHAVSRFRAGQRWDIVDHGFVEMVPES